MSYDKRPATKYAFAHDMVADGVFYVKGPAGKAGQLVDYGVEGLTEAINGTATAGTGAELSVGIAGTVEKYGTDFLVSTTAITTATSVRAATTDTAALAAYFVDVNIAADTSVAFTCKNGDATEGIGIYWLSIIWQD